jgi:uncharacterized protein (DUF2147 family)
MRRVAPHLLAVMLAGVAAVPSGAQQRLIEDDLIGDWVLPENGTVIHTYRCEDAVCAQIVKVPDPARKDIYNPDPVLRRRPLLGIVVASNLYRKGPATWQGRLYNTLNGYTYNGTVRLVEKNRFTFDGCLISVLFCHTKTYYRVEPPKPPKPKPLPAQRAVSSDRLPTAAVTKTKPARKAPRRADFEEFLKGREKPGAPALTEQEREILFKDFLAWREKR